MIINHPTLGPRDLGEFTYYGDAKLLERPDPNAKNAQAQFHDYIYIRSNPAGRHHELWYHEYGDQSWLVVTRDTVTHEIYDVQFAHAYKR
ncbi:MAG: sarcosine oxidase subunit delta [Pseudomonadota bacterium]